MLSMKSDEELGWMLDDYGIKHGPIVRSTRALYERKLRDVIAKERRIKAPADRSFCRGDEEEEVTVTKPRTANTLNRERTAHRFDHIDEDDDEDGPIVYRTWGQSASPGRQLSHQYSPEKAQVDPSSERGIPLWLQILLFIVVVTIMALVFISMEASFTEPFRRLT